MDKKEIWHAIEKEYRKDKKSTPKWPVHVVAKAGLVSESAGSLVKASVKWKYNRSDKAIISDDQHNAMKEAAIQTAVSAIRFLENL